MSEQGNLITLPPSAARWERPEGALPAVQADPMTMLANAVSRGMDPDTIKRLMDLQERWERNEAQRAYNEAFAAFKAEAVTVMKNRTTENGPLSGRKYAELIAWVDGVTPHLSKHGLSASWKLTKDDKDWIEVTCYLKHVKGHSESVSMGGPPDDGGAKSRIQARASTVSYLERYTLKAITGLAEKDDDKDGAAAKKGGAEPDAEGRKVLEACGSLPSLQEAWKGLTAAQRKTLNGVKEECKARIEAAEREASK